MNIDVQEYDFLTPLLNEEFYEEEYDFAETMTMLAQAFSAKHKVPLTISVMNRATTLPAFEIVTAPNAPDK